MKYRYLPLLVLALLVAVTSCAKRQTEMPVPEADVIVAPDGSGDYRTVSEAVANAREGDVIYVKPGTYEGAVEIETDRITLLGAGPGRSIIDADDEYAAVSIEGEDCVVAGFTVRNGSSHGIYVKSSGQQVSRCLIINNGDRGIYFSSLGGDPSAKIDHCTVADNDVSGIYIPSDNAETAITNCIVAFNGRGIVCDRAEGLMTVEYNCVFGDGDGFDRVEKGRGNIEEDPRFLNRGAGDYRLGSGSPCARAAADGSNIGCF